MSCDNASGPLNLIKDTGALDKCRVICEYKANYPSCTGTARNKGDHLQIIMETCVADVTYNRDKFSLQEVRVYSPSLHAFGGTKADAEIIIVHTRDKILSDKPEKLFICVPVKRGIGGLHGQMNSTQGDWFSFMPLIGMFYDNQPVVPTQISLPGWSLNLVIPKGDYYNYQGTSPFGPCSDRVEYIVYSLDQAVTIGGRELDMLKASMPKKTDIEARQYTNQRLHKLYWHTGNSQADGLGDVYLDCAMVYGDDPEDSKQGQIIKDSAQRTSVSGIGPSVSWGVVGGVMGSIVGIIILIKIWDVLKGRKAE